MLSRRLVWKTSRRCVFNNTVRSCGLVALARRSSSQGSSVSRMSCALRRNLLRSFPSALFRNVFTWFLLFEWWVESPHPRLRREPYGAARVSLSEWFLQHFAHELSRVARRLVV